MRAPFFSRHNGVSAICPHFETLKSGITEDDGEVIEIFKVFRVISNLVNIYSIIPCRNIRKSVPVMLISFVISYL
jgi:hypothetical protein